MIWYKCYDYMDYLLYMVCFGCRLGTMTRRDDGRRMTNPNVGSVGVPIPRSRWHGSGHGHWEEHELHYKQVNSMSVLASMSVSMYLVLCVGVLS